jgi:hypothetical protein
MFLNFNACPIRKQAYGSKTADNETACVCARYKFQLRDINYCLFIIVICEHAASYKNSRHTSNHVPTHCSKPLITFETFQKTDMNSRET